MDVHYKVSNVCDNRVKSYAHLQTTPVLRTPSVHFTPRASLHMHFTQTETRLQLLKQPVPRHLLSAVSFFASCLISFGFSRASRQTFRPPALGGVLQQEVGKLPSFEQRSVNLDRRRLLSVTVVKCSAPRL